MQQECWARSLRVVANTSQGMVAKKRKKKKKILQILWYIVYNSRAWIGPWEGKEAQGKRAIKYRGPGQKGKLSTEAQGKKKKAVKYKGP